ncbi:hypothetical protein [Streptomyces decoyicus]
MIHLAFAGASIDGGPHTRITWPAQHTPHDRNTLITYGTDTLITHGTGHGLALFAVLMLCDRQLGRIPVPAALLMAASRVRPGAHFPHDAAGPIVGALVARGLTPLTRPAAPAVHRIRATRLRPLVAAR